MYVSLNTSVSLPILIGKWRQMALLSNNTKTESMVLKDPHCPAHVGFRVLSPLIVLLGIS